MSDDQPIEEEMKCFGYYGFGSGVAMGRIMKDETPGSLPSTNLQAAGGYCGTCPLSGACWDELKKIMAVLLPDAVAEFEEMAKTLSGHALVEAWHNKHGIMDPYLGRFAANQEDAMQVLAYGKPKDRGPLTLEWPFKASDKH